jgi:hypothetical protein
MQLFQHIACPEHRLAMLKEFHRGRCDTVIVAIRIDAHFKGRRTKAARPLASKAEVESELNCTGQSSGFTARLCANARLCTA